jgi:FHS family L-fucose permease-like MFS transporter
LLSDNIGFKVAFFLVVACYAYILFFGYVKSKQKAFVSS